MDNALLIEDYKTMTMAQIAEKHSTSLTTVYRRLKASGVKTVKSSIKGVEFTEIHHQVITGSLLGDGSLTFPKSSRSAFFRIEHSIKQAEYVQYKYRLLEDLCRLRPRIHGQRAILTTANHPALIDIHQKWYPNGRKIVPVGEIEEHLSPLALAIWYLDDGGIRSNGVAGSIATASFTFDEVEFLADFLLRKYGIRTSLHNDSGYPRLYIPGRGRFIPGVGWERNESEFAKFVSIISPFVPACMTYKLGKV